MIEMYVFMLLKNIFFVFLKYKKNLLFFSLIQSNLNVFTCINKKIENLFLLYFCQNSNLFDLNNFYKIFKKIEGIIYESYYIIGKK